MKTHGKTGTPVYRSWASMVNRCTNQEAPDYYRYGGRGIKVCERWLNSFENFLADMGDRPSLKHTIDRENNDGNYEPDNCRWATQLEQAYNRRTNLSIDSPKGELNSIEAAEHYQLNKRTMYTRLWRGKPLTDPVEERGRLYPYKGKMVPVSFLIQRSVVPANTLRVRLSEGMDPEKAVTTPMRLPAKHAFNGQFLTVPEICKLTGFDDFKVRHHLRMGKTAEEAIEYLLSKRPQSI